MIEVIYFASLREQFGKEKETVEFSGKTISELKSHIAQTYKLSSMESYMVAVNEEFKRDDTVLANGDRVAFIPPVSGG